jgi:hypothetical protein
MLRHILEGEKKIFGTEVIAPVYRGGMIRVRIEALVWECRIDSDFSGWGIFKIVDGWRAELVRPAEIWEREEYASRLRENTLVIMACDESGLWWGAPIRGSMLVPVFLLEGLSVFDHASTCFDGASHWYLRPAHRFDSVKAAALRDSLEAGTPPDDVRISGLTRKERDLYALALEIASALADRRKSPERRRIERALRLGDGELVDYSQVPGGYRIRWRKGSRELTSILDGSLSVVSAGLCLSGRDREHDLTSLASLMAEQGEGHDYHEY